MTIDIEDLLLKASYEAGSHLRKHAFHPGTIEWKSENDPVTSRDKEAEEIIKNCLLSNIDMNIIAEESGVKQICNSKYTAIIDPLDGTKSFLRRDFDCSVSIAIEENKVLIAGAVYDFMRDILYIGFKGNSYILHQSKKVSAPKLNIKNQLHQHQLTIITNQDYAKLNQINFQRLKFLESSPEFYLSRKKGSIALALAHTAFGIHDATVLFPKGSSSTWDYAAGTYMLKSTGHYITDCDSNDFNYRLPTNGIIAVKIDFKNRLCLE